MQSFLSLYVPLKKNGKINIPLNIQHIKLDIGLSYSAPMSQYWLSNETDLFVYGFEPLPTSIETIKKGATKLDPSHGDPLNPTYIGERFFLIPCALGLSKNPTVQFYVTKNSCGCCSIYPPKYFEIEKVIDVPIFSLSNFFALFPFDSHPIIDYIKIDTQGSDLDIVKSGGSYLKERVVYITIEAENDQYQNTNNSESDIDQYMKRIGFVRDFSKNTVDPTYFNPKFLDYIQKYNIQIYQKG
jgi:hypothetical protein